MKESATASDFRMASIDCGSVYTCACLAGGETGKVYTIKVASRTEDPASAAFEALSVLCQQANVDIHSIGLTIYGTTAAANAVLQGNTARTALLVSRGCGDLFRQASGSLPGWNIPAPPYSDNFIFEINERLLPGGHVHSPLQDEEIRGLARLLREKAIEAVSVCFLHSYINPIHEQRARDILEEISPGLPVAISSDILPFPGEYQRAAAATLSASLRPIVEKNIHLLHNRLKSVDKNSPGFMVMLSDGNAADIETSSARAAGTLLSSAAGGITACSMLAAKTRRLNLIAMETGGSCTTLGIIKGETPLYDRDRTKVCLPSASSPLDLRCLSLGGNSIAGLNDGAICAGPLSAGADPGLACCGGALPTCTDALVVLGRISPSSLAFSGSPASVSLAAQSIADNIAAPLGLTVEEASDQILSSLNLQIIRSLQDLLEVKGLDPRDYTLVSYGGAGPLLSAEIARQCGIKYVLVPKSPSSYSALGMLSSVRRSYCTTLCSALEEAVPDTISDAYAELANKALQDFADQGIPSSLVVLERSIDLRYRDQLLEINLPFPSGKLINADFTLLGRTFNVSFNSQYGFTPDQPVIEIVRLRLSASLRGTGWPAYTEAQTALAPEPPCSRKIYFDGSFLDTPVYSRSSLRFAASLRGPAAIEEENAVTLVWPGMIASVDSLGNIIIDVEVV